MSGQHAPHDLLGTLSSTGGLSPTPSALGPSPGSILQPTPTPLQRTDKDFYRSLFGSLSSEPAPSSDPAPASPAPAPTSGPLDFAFPAFGEPSTPTASPAPAPSIQTSPGAGSGGGFGFPDFGRAPAPNGSGVDIFASLGAPSSSLPSPAPAASSGGQGPIDFQFPAFGASSPASGGVRAPVSHGTPGGGMGSMGGGPSPSGPSSSLFDMAPTSMMSATPTPAPVEMAPRREGVSGSEAGSSSMGSMGSFSSTSGGLFDFAPPPSAPRPVQTAPLGVAPPTPTPTGPSTDLFASFGSVGASSPPTPTSSLPAGPATDLFGSFGSLGARGATAPPPTPSTPTPTPSTSTPSHGSFSASPPAAQAPPGPTTGLAPTGTPSLDGLMRTFQRLMQSERYPEAEACRRHIAASKQIALLTPLLAQAKSQQDYVKALELRQSLEQWAQQQATPAQQAQWQHSPPASHRTFAQMQRLIEETAGPAPATRFHRQYNQPIASALQSGDLGRLVQLQGEAQQQLATYQSGIPIVGGDTVARWHQVLQKCIAELTQAQRHLAGIESHLKEADLGHDNSAKLFQAPRAVSFTTGLVEIYRLVKRIQRSMGFYESKASSLPAHAPFDSLWQEADRLWTDLVQFIQRLAEVQMPRVDALGKEQQIEEASFKAGSCSLCLLPFAPEDSTLKWAGASYHAPCANFYCNRLSTSPPTEESAA